MQQVANKAQLFKSNGDPVVIDDSKEIARGGEGKIIPLDSNYVAKIYIKDAVPISKAKFKYLTKLDKTFVKPIELLKDSGGNIAGFIMEYLSHDYFPIDAVFNKAFCQRHNIDEKYKRTITQKLINSVKAAHSLDVVVGDLSGFNIMADKHGDVKFIDVDSYGTPPAPHSGKQLDIIRDHLYDGDINKQSDYFALSVVVFNYLTYVHPFKGIHKKYPKTADRMIHRLPVFADDPELKVPKCYRPVKDKSLQDQFKRIFVDGERFLLSLDKVRTLVSVKKTITPTQIDEKELTIQTILKDQDVIDVYGSSTRCIIKTTQQFLVVNADTRKFYTITKKYNVNDVDEVYVGDTNIICRKQGNLYDQDFNVINNVSFSPNARYHQLGSLLIVFDGEHMYWLAIDQIVQNTIKTLLVPTYTPSFKVRKDGLIQHTGGKQYIFSQSQDNLSTIPTPYPLQTIYQRDNVGMAQYIDDDKIKFKYFHIDNLKMRFATKESDKLIHFAYQKAQSSSRFGMIYAPCDDALAIIRGNDFQRISEIHCSIMTQDTSLAYTQAGIIAWNEKNVWLINKK